MESPNSRRRRLTRERVRRYRQRENERSLRRIEALHQQASSQAEFDEDEIVPHDCGPMNCICQFCSSFNFLKERPLDKKFNSCCHKGKVKLPKPRDINGEILEYPDYLRKLLSDPSNSDYKNFRENIRIYNSSVSFASMGAKVSEVPGNGPYVFKVHGQVYHRTSHLKPKDGDTKKYAQLYVMDSTQATSERLAQPVNSNCHINILDKIDRFFRQHNRIAVTYQMMREVEENEKQKALRENKTLPMVHMVMRRDRQSDQRRYNAPRCNEIAMVFVNDDGEPPFERDIRIYPRNPNGNIQFININILSPNLDPMTYAILYPYGEPGWQPNWKIESYDNGIRRNRENVSMLQFKVAQTAIRSEFNPIISAGKLTQQWIVDSYLQVEANNLNFIRQRQNRLRTELYQGLADHMANVAIDAGVQAGVPVILPSSFQGSPRNMRERLQDAMAIFGKFGPPDLFITFTANPKWKEITLNLRPGEVVADRPDLVARVFKLKLQSLMEDITVKHVLGRAVAYVYTVEFQKRGLPHVHLLIVLHGDYKFNSPERIDAIVTAEIPDLEKTPRLYAIVTRNMMHGPCNTRCLVDGKCSKNFPKKFQNTTVTNVKGYPLYRRRQGNNIVVRGVMMNNQCVVPYNKFLLLKYDAHINVEVCTSLRSVKYIYKYIYKGFDCASVVVGPGNRQLLIYDEIATFIDARYVSAPEAMWRLLESPMHSRSHIIVRLPVHLPDQQRIIFEEGHEQEAIDQAKGRTTKLTAWFKLNREDATANRFLYSEIPEYYVFVQNKWKKRQRGGNKIISRMFTVSLIDQERFYLRLLLLHVPGANGYEFLRTVDNVTYESYKEAAFYRNLLSTDDEWKRCLEEAVIFRMPQQIRQIFAFICIYCAPVNVLILWTNFCEHMVLDYACSYDEETSKNLALLDIESILRQHGLSCVHFGLPQPNGVVNMSININQQEEQIAAEKKISTLNPQQMQAFRKIINSIDLKSDQKLFYLNGPGGTGKTYLYNTLINFVRGRGEIVLAYASTGIASTLMKDGRTIHSGFKLPVPLLETSVSSMKQNSPEAEILRRASLIIIDEITMLPKDGLRCIEKLLRELMKCDVPFGGKVLIIGGDFRQTLPVVPRGLRFDILEASLISSNLWPHFEHLSLITNMRSEGQNEFNNWLLDIGIGNIAPIEGLSENTIALPTNMIVTDNIAQLIFGEILNRRSIKEMSKRIILSTTNKKALGINEDIIEQLDGELKIYYSSDSIVSEDKNDVNNYPAEFLHAQTISGVPPHVLKLKRGAIVMLLRNLNPQMGLCNGTRMIVRDLHELFITCEIISESHCGDLVFVPRIDIVPSATIYLLF